MKTPLFDELEASKKEVLLNHLKLVLKANEQVNLTRIDSFDEGMVLHVEDSLIGMAELSKCGPGLMGDLGSGAGYPGIPLAVACDRECVLIDARQKKMVAVDTMLDQLSLSGQVNTFKGRAELLAQKEPSKFQVLTARALAPLSVLLELASPLLLMNGNLICYKSQPSDDEIEDAARVAKIVGMRMVSDRTAILNDSITRRIIMFEKHAKPEIKLPRQEGKAQKNPL